MGGDKLLPLIDPQAYLRSFVIKMDIDCYTFDTYRLKWTFVRYPKVLHIRVVVAIRTLRDFTAEVTNLMDHHYLVLSGSFFQ